MFVAKKVRTKLCCLLPKISGVEVAPCLLPKISGVKVSDSLRDLGGVIWTIILAKNTPNLAYLRTLLDIINIVINNANYSWKCQYMSLLLSLLLKGENDSFKRSITQSFNPQSMTRLLNERVQNSAPDLSTF